MAIAFRNRIALFYSITAAILVLLVFALIYLIVSSGVYSSLDNDLQKEVDDLYTEITVTPAGFSVEKEEWYEKEHNTLDINPIFIQFTDRHGKLSDRSPNLKESKLKYRTLTEDIFYDSLLDDIPVRQAQVPVRFKDTVVGYILVAVPLQDAGNLLYNLKRVLFITYPLLLIILFAVTRLVAGRSIKPVNNIIETAGRISRNTLYERIAYPGNKDELYTLSQTINNLLDRIESAVLREKQFTSDASHELRTPLAVVRGTLEVLIRKPRSQEEFVETIKYCIAETDRINLLVDQLLLLARFESQKEALKVEHTNISVLVLDTLSRNAKAIKEKNIKVETHVAENLYMKTDGYLLSVVLENLVSNAVKYSKPDGIVTLSASAGKGSILLQVTDNGIGIAKEEQQKVFGSFYRSRPDEHIQTKGSGLGLSIVKRICELLDIEITIESELAVGTKVTLTHTT
ncbi:HAMP domain-containing protein [Flavobacterium sp. Sd200]|uniref:sensor histidine kinase n=1 Tax=Flavobacterium sp. Sd200 TaxID=2692211 RepID=UPI00136EC1E5|nr:HAMP domain-containing sensor histidine kinase [Flavobacterium sp. Sd200]MXN89618.1 HAMP domain-containing protein [Flavobacterium sp. Sd200]